MVVFAFLAMLSWGVGDFFIQKTIRKIGGLETLLWIGLIGTLILIPFAIKDLALLKNPLNLRAGGFRRKLIH